MVEKRDVSNLYTPFQEMSPIFSISSRAVNFMTVVNMLMKFVWGMNLHFRKWKQITSLGASESMILKMSES
jgi:hypothetical protein